MSAVYLLLLASITTQVLSLRTEGDRFPALGNQQQYQAQLLTIQ